MLLLDGAGSLTDALDVGTAASDPLAMMVWVRVTIDCVTAGMDTVVVTIRAPPAIDVEIWRRIGGERSS